MKTPLDSSGDVRVALLTGYEKDMAQGVQDQLPEGDQQRLQETMHNPAFICTIEEPLELEKALGLYHDAHDQLASRFFGIGRVLPGTIRARRKAKTAQYMQRQLNPKEHPFMETPRYLR